MLRIIITIAFILLPLNLLFGQVIQGTVMNSEGEPLAGVHIQAAGLDLTAVSDQSGHFRLHLMGKAEDTVTLYVTMVGYEHATLPVVLEGISQEELHITLTESVYRSETVVVTATRTRRDVEEVAIPVQVVTGEEIRRSGSMRLSDVLSEQTGMQIVNDHGTGIQVQGFAPDYTLVMIDGNPVIGRTAGTLDLTRVSVQNVEQIEIVKGPSSALWGSDALAGVVNIITERRRKGITGGITTRYGENKTLDLSGDISLNGRGYSNDFFVNRNSSGGYKLSPSSVAQTVPEFENNTLSYRGSLDLSDRITLSGSARWFTETQDNLSSIVSQEGSTQLLKSDASRTDFMARPELDINLTERLNLNASWLTSFYRTNSALTFLENGELFEETEFNQYYNKPELQAGYRWSNSHHTITGAGAIFERIEAERYPSSPEFTTQFLFAQHSFTPSGLFEITGGLRYDTHSEYSSQLSPKLSTRYRAANWIQFRASTGRGFKAPEFRQLFLDFTNSTAGYSVYGSSTVAEGIERQKREGNIAQILIPLEDLDEIRAESSWAVNAGFDLDPIENLRLRVNVFRNDVTNLIETAPVARRTSGQSVFTYFNVDEVKTQGLETVLRWRFLDDVSASIGYQFLDALRRIERERTVQDEQGEVVQRTDVSFEPMFNRSRHSGTVRLFYENEGGWGANVRGTLRGRYGLFDRNGNGFVDEDEYETGYTVWNMALSRKLGNMITVRAGADNLFNYRNINQPYLAGRLWYAQISMLF